MQWLILFLFLLLPFLFLFGSTRLLAQTSAPAPGQVTQGQIQNLSRIELEKRLLQLETQPPPPPKPGAMCYAPMPPMHTAEYLCPKCGEKTVYTKEAFLVSREIPACRRELEKLKGITSPALSLDESSFCHHCSPEAKRHELALIVTYPDGTIHKAALSSSMDLVYLQNFLGGKLTYGTFNESTLPLKQVIPRLRELLGLKQTDTNPSAK